MAKYALYGGTFDPPHIGHVLAVQYALSLTNVNIVHVVPCYAHAYGKEPVASYNDRLVMTSLAFEEFASVLVLDTESRLPAPNYTINTLEYLQKQNPAWADEWLLLMGEDAARDLRDKEWHRSEELLEMTEIFAAPRSVQTADGLPGILPGISSTRVRRELARGLPSLWLERALPLRVRKYIDKQELYRG